MGRSKSCLNNVSYNCAVFQWDNDIQGRSILMYKMMYMTSYRDNKRRGPVSKSYPFMNKGGEQSVKNQGKYFG
jgi:hypothetical protein